MENHLRNHSQQEKPEKSKGEPETGPIMAVFHHIQTITSETHLSVKVKLLKSFHGNLGSLAIVARFVLSLEFRGVEFQVVANWLVGKLNLLVDPRSI